MRNYFLCELEFMNFLQIQPSDSLPWHEIGLWVMRLGFPRQDVSFAFSQLQKRNSFPWFNGPESLLQLGQSLFYKMNFNFSADYSQQTCALRHLPHTPPPRTTKQTPQSQHFRNKTCWPVLMSSAWPQRCSERCLLHLTKPYLPAFHPPGWSAGTRLGLTPVYT